MAKEYVVSFTHGCQISPDDWTVIHPSMKVTEQTTVKEIEDFYRRHVKHGYTEVRLIELQQSQVTRNIKEGER